MTEGLGTGIPKIQAAMKRNGSPKAKFETDENWLWFVAKLPIHRAFVVTARDGKSQPDQRRDHVTDHVMRLLGVFGLREVSAPEMMLELQLTHRPTLRTNSLHPAIAAGLIEMTEPDSPRSRRQKYRATPAGKAALAAIEQGS